ncbi:MAG TPA: Hpt domain-containing protein [Thermoanaerobaculia bacterium]|jgi:HPt (histidine-containing phosphotransfer) domain-containing protein|nr:Hpt domain-containing protein [Thermoanaerobaculia bacterium]
MADEGDGEEQWQDLERTEELRELRALFARRLPERTAEIEAAWEEARRPGAPPAALGRFHRLVHSLSGSGAVFGYPALTLAARRLEKRLRPLLLGKGPLSAEAEEAALALLAELRRAVSVEG